MRCPEGAGGRGGGAWGATVPAGGAGGRDVSGDNDVSGGARGAPGTLGMFDDLGLPGGEGVFGAPGTPVLPFGEMASLPGTWEEAVTLTTDPSGSAGGQFRNTSLPELSSRLAAGTSVVAGANGQADIRNAYSAPALAAPGARMADPASAVPSQPPLVEIGVPHQGPFGSARVAGYPGASVGGPFRQDALGQAHGPSSLGVPYGGGLPGAAGMGGAYGPGAVYHAGGGAQVGLGQGPYVVPGYVLGAHMATAMPLQAQVQPGMLPYGYKGKDLARSGKSAAPQRGGAKGVAAGKKSKSRKGAKTAAAAEALTEYPGGVHVHQLGTFQSPYVPSQLPAPAGTSLEGLGVQLPVIRPQPPHQRPITDAEARQMGQSLQHLENVASQLDSQVRATMKQSLLRLSRSWVARNPGVEGNAVISAPAGPDDLPSEATRNVDRCIAGLLYYPQNRITGPQEAS